MTSFLSYGISPVRRPIARVGDKGSHGGVILTGSHNTFVNGRPIARVTDLYGCATGGLHPHGTNPIVTGSKRTTANGLPIARVGDHTACGATIITGSPNTTDGG